MEFRPRFREEPEINLIPLIDVLLMTLIFLLVTTSFSHEARLRLQLPEAGVDTKIEAATLRIAIDARGQYFINNQQLLNTTPETLRAAMQQTVGGRKDPVVVIQADRKTPHEAVVRVMEAARRLGYTHLTFATQAPGSEP
ncbi:MAG TPA: biopolymer transporter ExbD [Gammaproteobacteria bacterium]|jgi:biopolymer transport protein ExbD|nr:biopolymer transporter ExbD [Gammaproteobacteria bacterium]